MDHRTGKPLDKIPDYVTNKKKKKSSSSSSSDRLDDEKVDDVSHKTHEKSATEVQPSSTYGMNYEIADGDEELDIALPSSSGLIRSFQFSDDTNYDILLDIDEFSDFQLLSPAEKDYESHEKAENESFSIIDASGELLHIAILITYSKLTLFLISF